MIIALFRQFCHVILRLRYRIEIRGFREVLAHGTHGVLFLPCHPALVDPIILMSTLYKDYAPRAIADADAVGAWGVRYLVRRFGTRVIPGMAKRGAESRAEIERVLKETAAGLQQGENVLLYPSGHRMRSRREVIGANSAVQTLLQNAPGTRVVLVRTRGLWGSSFSLASTGPEPNLVKLLLRGFGVLLANGLFFTPRRRVTLEFVEPQDLPSVEDRGAFNRYLEAFYNAEPLPVNTQVPSFFWQGTCPIEMPEPPDAVVDGDIGLVPQATREIVTHYLQELTGVTTLRDEAKLAHDLGMDSLARAELLAWLEQEFGFSQGNVDSLATVADVLLAASGEAVAAGHVRLAPVPARWFQREETRPLHIPQGETVTEIFLKQAQLAPDYPIIADQKSGVKSYRNLITGILALRPAIQQLPGDTVGIMLPASVAATLVYLTVLFAGKTPVMVNWTMGMRNLMHTLEQTGVHKVITAQQLLIRLELQGVDLHALQERLLPLETLASGVSSVTKLRAMLSARFSWAALRHARISPTAVILTTSGSESLPKAVPLTHANVLSNMRDILKVVPLTSDDRMLGMLPPFHSFGLCDNILIACCLRLRTVFHVNPTEGALLARLIAAYRLTMVLGTPTFLHGIARAARGDQLSTLRLAVTGAEEYPPRAHAALLAHCPRIDTLLGYGITECSPIVAFTHYDPEFPECIGHPFPSVRFAIMDVETGQRAAVGVPGLMLLQGPNIFHGYLGDAPSPFIEFEGEQWYRTGDLVSLDEQGLLAFRGRLKRFVKIGGEMVSLPAIESVLKSYNELPENGTDGQSLAVLAAESLGRPELVLFTTEHLERDEVNRRLRDAGLSGLHNIRRVIHISSIPVLGTGKTDYRALQAQLAGA